MTKKMTELKKLAFKADENEIKALISIAKLAGMKEKDIREIKETYSFKGKAMAITSNSSAKGITQTIYAEEINKIKYISENEKLINQIGGLKILLFGRTGTGKTTAIKSIISELLVNKNNEFKEVNFEKLISYKMGQSQINILNLAEEIKMLSKTKRQIIFIDELDSIVSNRGSNNDIGEHHRIVATFIKFLDNLPSDSIIFSATNIPEKIDEAVLRRYTLKIKGKEISFTKFVELLKKEFNIPTNKFAKFIEPKDIKYTFTISDLNDFTNGLHLKKAIEQNEVDPFVYFVTFFKDKFSINFENLSERTKIALKKEGVDE